MKMKTLQQVLTFFYEKWKTKVKGFSKNNNNIELTKNKNQQIFDFSIYFLLRLDLLINALDLAINSFKPKGFVKSVSYTHLTLPTKA